MSSGPSTDDGNRKLLIEHSDTYGFDFNREDRGILDEDRRNRALIDFSFDATPSILELSLRARQRRLPGWRRAPGPRRPTPRASGSVAGGSLRAPGASVVASSTGRRVSM